MEATIGLEELLMFADEIDEGNLNANEQPASEAAGSEEAGSSSGFDAEEVELLSAIGQALSEAMSVELSDMDLDDELSDEQHQELM